MPEESWQSRRVTPPTAVPEATDQQPGEGKAPTPLEPWVWPTAAAVVAVATFVVGWAVLTSGRTQPKPAEGQSTASNSLQQSEHEIAKTPGAPLPGEGPLDALKELPFGVAKTPGTPLTAEELFARSSPAVVQVVSRDLRGRPICSGSGFLVGTKGLIVTNHHVIEKAYTVQVVFADETAEPVLGAAAFHEEIDVAILCIAPRVSPRRLELAGYELPVGTKVYAIGNPSGFTNTLSDGLVSGYREAGENRVIQTTAPISPGSSGGPLLAADGRVIGVTTFLVKGAQNLNFAVPASQFAQVLHQCEGTGRFTRFPLARRTDWFARVNPRVAWANEQDYETAIRDLDEVIRLDPKNVQAYIDRGYLWNRAFKRDKAIRDFDQAIRIDPTNSEAYFGRGFAQSLTSPDNAIADYDQAIRFDPSNAGYYFYRAGAWRGREGDAEKKVKDLDTAIRLDPQVSEFYSARAFFWSSWSVKKDYDHAIRDYGEAMRLDPTNARLYTDRGGVWVQKKEYDEAIRDYHEAIRLDPNQSDAYRSCAWLLATCPDDSVRNGRKAVRLARKAYEITEAERQEMARFGWADYPSLWGRTLEVLAAAHAECGDFDEAERCQRKALDEDPELRKRIFEREREKARKCLELYKQKKPYRENR